MPPLYPRMRERPMEFRINHDAPLAEGLVFAGLGGRGCVGSALYPDCIRGNHGRFVNANVSESWAWSPELRRIVIASDGLNDRVEMYRLPLGAGYSFSILAYIYTNTTTGPVVLRNIECLGNTVHSVYTHHIFRWVTTDGRVELCVPKGSDWAPRAFSDSSISPNIWYLAAGTFDGTYARVWIDGVPSTPLSRVGATNAPRTYFWIGSDVYEVARDWSGYLADVMLFGRTLSAYEIGTLADKSNVDLRIGGVPLILPPRRRFFPSVEIPAPTFNPAWAQTVNSYIGLGRT